MKLQKQPNRWSCVPTAFANLLDIDVKYLIDQIGHDGSSIIFPHLPEPLCRRGFHPQEVLFALLKEDIHFETFESIINCLSIDNKIYHIHFITRLTDLLSTQNGVLIGNINDQNHCVTWYENIIHDPNGTIYNLCRFTIDTAYLLIQ